VGFRRALGSDAFRQRPSSLGGKFAALLPTSTTRRLLVPTACRGDKIERMASRVQNPNQPDRPTDESVHDVLLAWFTTPRLQDELIGRDREAVKTVLDLLRRRMRQQRQPSRSPGE